MQLAEKQLISHLNKQTLSPVYLIHGDIPLLLKETADKIRRSAEQQGYLREIFFIENSQDWQHVQQALENFSLLSQKNFLEIRYHKTKLDEVGVNILSTYLKNIHHAKCVLISTNKLSAAQQKTNWYQLIDRCGVIIGLRPVTHYELPTWIAERLKQANLIADNDSIQLLAELTQGNLSATEQAIEKLSLLYQNQSIDKKAIATVINDNPSFNIFDLTHYILLGIPTRVIQVLQNLHFVNTEPTLILWALARELRLLHELAIEKQRGKTMTQILATQWTNRKPLLQKALLRLSVEKIRSLLQIAEKIDRVIKGAVPGNAWQFLETFCLAFTGVDIFYEI